MNTYQVNDTITLATTFMVGTPPVLTDPTTVQLVVEAPDGTEQTYTWAGSTITRDSVGTFHKDYSPAAQVGVYSYEWTGTGAAAGVEQGQFVVNDLLAAHPSDLTTIGRVKVWLGQTDPSNDPQLQQLTTAASAAVMAYCQREFAPISTGVTRTFPLLGDGYIRFGGWDLQTATQVQIDTDTASTPTTIPDTQYQLGPVSKPNGVYTMLRFYTFSVGPILRQAMGIPRQVAVTGTWGWPSIPADVEQACIIAASKWFKRDQVSYSNELPVPAPSDGLNLPLDARVLLAPYRRPL